MIVTGRGGRWFFVLFLLVRALRGDYRVTAGPAGAAPSAHASLTHGRPHMAPAHPREAQPLRILTAGDLRSAHFQRIVTTQGSGAEAALARYYQAALQAA